MKEQQLDFRKGISNNPSDVVCDDNSLSRCENMYFDGVHHRPIQESVGLGVTLKATDKLLFVHNISDGTKNYLYLNANYNIAYASGVISLEKRSKG